LSIVWDVARVVAGQSCWNGKRRLATVLATSLCKETYLLLPTTPQLSSPNFVSLKMGAAGSSETSEQTSYPILHGIINHRTFAVEIVTSVKSSHFAVLITSSYHNYFILILLVVFCHPLFFWLFRNYTECFTTCGHYCRR
jgi:hypothetical protein